MQETEEDQQEQIIRDRQSNADGQSRPHQLRGGDQLHG